MARSRKSSNGAPRKQQSFRRIDGSGQPMLTDLIAIDSKARDEAIETVQQSNALLGGPDRTFLIQKLHDPDEAVRERALDALIKIAPSEIVLRGLLEALHDREQEVQWWASDVLSEHGAPCLLEWLQHPDPELRSEIAEFLGTVRDAAAIPALSKALREDPGQAVRCGAAESLGEIGHLAAIPALLAALSHEPDPIVRSAVVYSLQNIGGTAVVPSLIKALSDDPDPDVRAESAWCLGQIKCATAVPGLVNALSTDPLWYVRSRAADALGWIGSSEAVPALVEALCRNQDQQIHELAALALELIADASAVPMLVVALKHVEVNEVRRIIAETIEDILASTANAQRAAAAAATTAWKAGRLALIELCKDDPSKIVRLQAHESLQRLAVVVGPEPDAIGNRAVPPPISDDSVNALLRATRQLLTFCHVGEILAEDGAENETATFVIGCMAEQLLDRKHRGIPGTTLRNHLSKVCDLFAEHLPDVGPIFDAGRGERGYTITPQWWPAWRTAMRILGRDLKISDSAKRLDKQ
jgi:HEAT repeat protein